MGLFLDVPYQGDPPVDQYSEGEPFEDELEEKCDDCIPTKYTI